MGVNPPWMERMSLGVRLSELNWLSRAPCDEPVRFSSVEISAIVSLISPELMELLSSKLRMTREREI